MGQPFIFCFIYGPEDDLIANQKAHMTKIKALVDAFLDQHPNELSVEFAQGDFAELKL